MDFKVGQKWISNAEPDLGMGRVVGLEHRQVTIAFDLIDEVRTYAREKAPLTRVMFEIGDVIRTSDDITIQISSVVEKDQILIYQGDYNGTATAIIETNLHPNVRFNKPAERLFTLQFDDNRWFNLRYETLKQRAAIATAMTRGLSGPRVVLIPHQLYIASEVAQRYAPRVLLADEVGLGKTIEAGLIIHEQLITERAQRVLIIVPPALTFQWFVEMIRRFNLQFTILDEERCLQIEADNRPEDEDETSGLDNPFDAQQLVLCSLDLFTQSQARLEMAVASPWDLIIVDEAHHLAWHEDQPSAQYLAVEALGRVSAGLLLLTATPEQLGRMGHFSRLRLLDPSRYHDYKKFIEEETGFEAIAATVRDLRNGDEVKSAVARARIKTRLGESHREDDDAALISALLDRHGTGRVLYRNVRESVQGFSRRLLKTWPLEGVAEGAAAEFEMYPSDADTGWLVSDPRVSWLVDLIGKSKDKFLIIASRQTTAIMLDRFLKEKTTIRSATFHESMDLVARDRAANYFADSEYGAQVLICSEIGSEGRNFQFAHNMIMFDLPLGPDLLEQRIGRLDRIGQSEDIKIHVPYVADSTQHQLLRWYNEALGLFERPNAVAQGLFDEYFPFFQIESSDPASAKIKGARIERIETPKFESNTIDGLIDHTRAVSESRLQQLKDGRDQLLELNSHRPEVSKLIIEDIVGREQSDQLEHYLEQSFEMFGLESEPLSPKIQRIKPTEAMVRHSPVSLETADRFHYPELPDEGITITYDRDTALAREDVNFLTWENPLVEQAMDAVLSDTSGNCSVIVVKLAGVGRGTLLLETIHVPECIAPGHLNANRFLPPSIVRTLVTPDLKDVADSIPFTPLLDTIDLPHEALGKIITSQSGGLKTMLQFAETCAEAKLQPLLQSALSDMQRHLNNEIGRLETLSAVNANVRPDEIDYFRASLADLTELFGEARVRLEALRVIVTA